jgi:hypothetical protein
MAQQDQETSQFTLRQEDLKDPDLYKFNQVLNFIQSQISSIRNNGRFTGTMLADSIKAKMADSVPADTDVVPWGTIKRYLSPAATRQAFVANNWLGTPSRPVVQSGSGAGGGTGDYRFTNQTETLVANTTIASPYTPDVNDFLTIFVTQGAANYTIAFDATFAAGVNTNIPAENGVTTVFQFRGQSDNLWWLISAPVVLQ